MQWKSKQFLQNSCVLAENRIWPEVSLRQSGPGAQKYNTNQRKYKMIYPEICSLKVDSIPPDAGCRKGMCDFHISTVVISSSVQQLVRLKSWPVGNCRCPGAHCHRLQGRSPSSRNKLPKLVWGASTSPSHGQTGELLTATGFFLKDQLH